MNPSVGSGYSGAVTAGPADLGARKCHESGLRPNPVGEGRPDGGARRWRGRSTGLHLYDLGDLPADDKGRPPELLGLPLPAAPMGWRCVTLELEFPEWPEPLDAAVPRGEYQA